jgi:hypothetical protein
VFILTLAYAFDWTEGRIEWILDGVSVAVLTNDTAGPGFPQTPSRVTIGVWCPACYSATPGLVGIPVNNNFDDYAATVGTLEVINYNPATEYTYSDMSGSSSSVVIHQGSKLTRGEIAGIVVAGFGALVIIAGALFYWFRRRGGGTQHDPEPEIVADKTSDVRYPENLERLEREVEPATPGRRSEAPAGGRLGPDLEIRAGGRLGLPSEDRPGGRLNGTK